MNLTETETSDRKLALTAANKLTRQIALGHYENFPVGSVLVPKALRQDFYNLYAFMRIADDFADEPHRPIDERLRLLGRWREHLRTMLTGESITEPVFLALRETSDRHQLPTECFDRLLDAFQFDAEAEVAFATFRDLMWYTARSAEPVGQLVLALFGYRDPERMVFSNDICSALQLINFLQDAGEDLRNGRSYFPREYWHGEQSVDELRRSPAFPLVASRLLDDAERLLVAGAELPEMVEGRLKYELRAVLVEAFSMVRKLRALKGDARLDRPKLNKIEHLFALATALSGPVRSLDRHKR